MTAADVELVVPGFEPFKERWLMPGLRYDVYRNLNVQKRTGRVVWSIRDRASGLVVGHASGVTLAGATVHIDRAAQHRIAAGGARTVHAWVTGRLVSYWPDDEFFSAISYRPHSSPDFIDVETGKRIDPQQELRFATFNRDGMWVLP